MKVVGFSLPLAPTLHISFLWKTVGNTGLLGDEVASLEEWNFHFNEAPESGPPACLGRSATTVSPSFLMSVKAPGVGRLHWPTGRLVTDEAAVFAENSSS